MTIRNLAFATIAFVGLLLSHFAMAGGCGSAEMAAMDLAKGECVCANGWCATPTLSACSNCMVVQATLDGLAFERARTVQSAVARIPLRPEGQVSKPEYPPPQPG